MASKTPSKKGGGLGKGLLAGAAIGVATALYLQTAKGKSILKEADRKAKTLQKRVLAESKKVEKLTRKNYDTVVSNVLKYHSAGKDISENELPEIKKYLLGKWAEIQVELKKDSGKKSKKR